jgi:uncharacterized membrane protein YagU involved in acid resistance
MTVLWAGLACGVTDITAALVVYRFFGITPIRLLQGIASGLLGQRAFTGGLATALLGLGCHFVVAFSAAATYVGLTRLWPALIEHTVPAGVLYGVAVYFFMNRVVVPLSRVRRSLFSLKMMVVGIVIHIFCVGLPIALTVRRFSP